MTKLQQTPAQVQKTRLQELKQIVKCCFGMIAEPDLKEISNRTGLCVSTLYRLKNEKITLFVRFGTIQALARAAGLAIIVRKRGMRITVDY